MVVRRILVSIDPGVAGTGWAQWKGSTLVKAGVIYPRRNLEDNHWWERAMDVAMKFRHIIQQLESDAAYDRVRLQVAFICEFPQHMEGVKGIAAQGDSGIHKMSHLTGMIHGMNAGYNFIPVTPMQWKGQLPKSVVIDRVRQVLGTRACKDHALKAHAWDAVGLGLWALHHPLFR